MPYLAKTFTGKDMEKENQSFVGPHFSEEALKSADRMEWWASEFLDQGPDWNEWRLFKEEEFLSAIRKAGF
jgi:hypothetical protein